MQGRGESDALGGSSKRKSRVENGRPQPDAGRGETLVDVISLFKTKWECEQKKREGGWRRVYRATRRKKKGNQ